MLKVARKVIINDYTITRYINSRNNLVSVYRKLGRVTAITEQDSIDTSRIRRLRIVTA